MLCMFTKPLVRCTLFVETSNVWKMIEGGESMTGGKYEDFNGLTDVGRVNLWVGMHEIPPTGDWR